MGIAPLLMFVGVNGPAGADNRVSRRCIVVPPYGAMRPRYLLGGRRRVLPTMLPISPHVLTTPFGKHLAPEEGAVSRGPGRIEQSLRALFRDQPDGIFTTAELCRDVYGRRRIEKKHRVAVLRALKSLARRSMPTLWRTVSRYERSDDLWFDHRIYAKRSSDSASALAARPPKR
jgi:hypothetical protein